jgi:hypothetical protein
VIPPIGGIFFSLSVFPIIKGGRMIVEIYAGQGRKLCVLSVCPVCGSYYGFPMDSAGPHSPVYYRQGSLSFNGNRKSLIPSKICDRPTCPGHLQSIKAGPAICMLGRLCIGFSKGGCSGYSSIMECQLYVSSK